MPAMDAESGSRGEPPQPGMKWKSDKRSAKGGYWFMPNKRKASGGAADKAGGPAKKSRRSVGTAAPSSDIAYASGTFLALRGDTGAAWICEVTEDASTGQEQVHVQWLMEAHPGVYDVGASEEIDASRVLCEIELTELEQGKFYLTSKMRAKIDECLAQPPPPAEGDAQEDEDEEEEEGDQEDSEEAKPKGPPKKRAKVAASSPKKKAVPKKLEPLASDPFWDAGELPLQSVVDGVQALRDKLALRAVRLGDAASLRKLVAEVESVSSLHRPMLHGRSVTALLLALLQEKLELADLILGEDAVVKAASEEKPPRTRASCPTPSMVQTGCGSVSFQSYRAHVRKVKLSRGGKEGNQAFLKDANLKSGYERPAAGGVDDLVKWLLQHRAPLASIKHVHTSFMKKDNFTDELYNNLGHACRSGGREAASYIAELALKTDAYGLNAMHTAVLRPIEGEIGEDGPFAKQKPQVFTKKADDNFRVMPLHLAAINPDVRVLQAVAKAMGGSISETHTDEDGRCAVHYAAACESTGNLEFLLAECGHHADAQDDYGTTPLMIACMLGRVDNARLLLEKGADPSLSNSQVKALPPARRGRRAFRGFAVEENGLNSAHLAVEHERLDCLRLLLEKGVPANTADKLERRSLLHRACFQGSVEIALALLEAKAKVSSRDKLKRTPLIMAAMGGSTKICSHLLAAKAQVQEVDSSGNSALHYAAGYGWVHVVHFLVTEAGAGLIVNSWKCSPVFIALMKSHFGLVDWFVHNATDLDPEQTDGDGRTLLSLACGAPDDRWAAVLRTLLERGACVNTRDAKGLSPLHHLALTDQGLTSQSLLETLHAANAELNSLDEDGRTPLLCAVQTKKMPLVQQLLSLKADAGVQGQKGMNLLHMMASQAIKRSFERSASNFNVTTLKIEDSRPGLLRALTGACSQEQLKHMANAADDAGNTPLHLCTADFINDFQSQRSHYGVTTEQIDEWDKQRRAVFFDFLDLYLSTTGTSADVPLAAPKPVEPKVEGDQKKPVRVRPQFAGRPPVPLCPSSGKPMRWVAASESGARVPTCLATGKDIATSDAGYFQGDAPKDAFSLAAIGQAGKTVLHMLAEMGDLESTRSLLQRLAKAPTAITAGGISPLSTALASTTTNRFGSLETVVTALLEQTDAMALNTRSSAGKSVLHAVVALHREAVGGAAEAQQQPRFRFGGGLFGGHTNQAPKLEPAAVVRLAQALLLARADTALVDASGRSPLHHACTNRAGDLIQAFLEARADPMAVDTDGRTLLHYLMDSSKGEESFELEHAVLAAAGDQRQKLLNARDRHGRTAMHYAFVKFADDESEIIATAVHSGIGWKFDKDGALVNAVKNDQVRKKGVSPGQRLQKIGDVEVAGLPEAKIRQVWKEQQGGKCKLTLKNGSGQSSLHCGTAARDPVEAVTSLCVEDLEVDVRDVHGVTPLLYASSRGATICTLCLVKRQADLHAEDGLGQSALARALLADHRDYAIMLLQKGLRADGSLQLQGGQGPVRRSYFWRAMEQGHFGVAHLLLEEGFPLFRALQDALDIGKAELALTLLRKVRDDAILQGRVPDTGDSLLHVLCRASPGRLGADSGRRLAEGLCQRGIAPASANAQGELPLHLAAASLNQALMQWLLDREPSAAQKCDSNGRAPLHCALLPEATGPDQQLAALRLLGAATGSKLVSACVGTTSGDGVAGRATLLTIAVDRRQEDLAHQLMEAYGADINVADEQGMTPLMWGAKANVPTTVGRLLQARAQVDTVDATGRSVLHHCVQPLPYGSYENEALLQQLCEARATLDLQDKALKTPLALAYGQDSGRMARVLKAAGAKKPGDPTRFSRAKSAILAWSGPAVDFEADSAAAVAAASEKAAAKRELPVHKCYGMEGQNKVAVLDGEPYDVMMVKVDIKKGEFGENNFYHMQLVHESARDLYVLFTRWGRIGETGMFQRTPQENLDQAKKEWAKLFKSKSGNEWESRAEFEKKPKRYSLISLEHSGVKRSDLLKKFVEPPAVECQLPFTLQRTFKTITALHVMQGVMARHNINTDAMPFGRLKKESLQQGLALLKSIADQIEVVSDLKKQPGVDGATLTEAKEKLLDLSSDYYTLVPKARFASEPVQPIRTERQLNEEWTMLQDLLEMEVAAKILLAAKSQEQTLHPLDYVSRALGVQMDQVPWESEEHKLLKAYLEQTSDGASCRASAVYRLQRRGEAARMTAKCQGLGRHRLLWHGTPTSNLIGILAQGLRVAPPEAPVSGYAFGKGIYFADMASKSMGYCRAGGSEPKYLFLAEVALGESFPARVATYMEEPMPGTNSTMALGRRGPDWEAECLTMANGVQIPLGKPREMSQEEAEGDEEKDIPAVCLQNREYIVYDSAQVRLRYLIELDNGPRAGEGAEGVSLNDDKQEDSNDDEDEEQEEDSDADESDD